MSDHAVIVHHVLGEDFGADGRLAMEDGVRSFSARPAYAILRYGAVDDPTAAERRIDL